MNTNTVLVILALLIVGGLGYYYFMSGDEDVTPTPAPSESNATPDDVTGSGDATPTDESDEATDESAESEGEVDNVDESLRGEDKGGDGPSVTTVTLDSFNYGYSQDEIRVEEGDTVTLTLTNSDGLHDWMLDEFDVATEQINEGETTTVTFVADAAGEYEYYCSVGNHREQGMVGTLIVEPADE